MGVPHPVIAMKTYLLCVLIASLLSVPFAIAQQRSSIFDKTTAGAGEKKDLLGEWEGYLTDGDGSQQGQRRMNLTLTITDGKITSGGQGNMMGEGTYKVSGGAKLRHIDATDTAGQYQGKLYQGIFTVEGDTLKWCAGNPGKGRPSALKTSTGAGHFLMVLTRKK